MPGNFKKNDLRVLKTRRALFEALLELLRRQPFGKITVYDVCTQALVSRTAFYAHFYDKYDLLEQSLEPLRKNMANLFFSDDPRALEDYVCGVILKNRALIAHVLEEADREVLALTLRFFSPTAEEAERAGYRQGEYPAELACFLAGGLWNSVLTQLRGCRSEESLRANIGQICRLVRLLTEWKGGGPC